MNALNWNNVIIHKYCLGRVPNVWVAGLFEKQNLFFKHVTGPLLQGPVNVAQIAELGNTFQLHIGLNNNLFQQNWLKEAILTR